MNLADLQKEAHAIAVAKGWHDHDDEVTFGDRMALVHSELSEALEAYREWGLKTFLIGKGDRVGQQDYKPEGVAYEMADVVIRVADTAEHYGVDLDQQVAQLREVNWTGAIYDQIETFGEWIALCHYNVSTAMFHHWGRDSSGNYSGSRPWWHVALLLKYLQLMAAHYNVDLDAAIAAKMEYNRTRPYRHGGKAL